MITITIEKEGTTTTFYAGSKFNKFFANLLLLWLNFATNMVGKYQELLKGKNNQIRSHHHYLLASYLQVDPCDLELVHEEVDYFNCTEIYLHQNTLTEYILHNGYLIDERLAI